MILIMCSIINFHLHSLAALNPFPRSSTKQHVILKVLSQVPFFYLPITLTSILLRPIYPSPHILLCPQLNLIFCVLLDPSTTFTSLLICSFSTPSFFRHSLYLPCLPHLSSLLFLEVEFPFPYTIHGLTELKNSALNLISSWNRWLPLQPSFFPIGLRQITLKSENTNLKCMSSVV